MHMTHANPQHIKARQLVSDLNDLLSSSYNLPLKRLSKTLTSPDLPSDIDLEVTGHSNASCTIFLKASAERS